MIKTYDKVQILICENNSYHIFENAVLSSGPHTTVYLGKIINTSNNEDNVNDCMVAIKTIDKKKIKNVQILKNEINMINKIGLHTTHKNIVKYYDVDENEHCAYIVMEYCDSGNLSKILGRPVKEHYVKYYMKQILDGLKFLQDNNIIHCDIKPDNILLINNKKTVKICDFGFSKHMSSENDTENEESICGSPYYMAPEIFKSKKYGHYTDIWSVGIIFYEMLYGERPFARCDDVAQLIKKLEKHTKITPPKFTLNMVSDECVVLMQLMLQKNINNRATLPYISTHSWLCEQQETTNGDGGAYSFDTFTHSCGFMKNNVAIHDLNTSKHHNDSYDENTTVSSNERNRYNEKQESSNTSNDEIFNMDV